MYDLIIIGGGPAAVAAGITAARKKLKTLVITDFFGGQWIIAADIQNFIGFKSISGLDMAKALGGHLKAQQGIEIKEQAMVSKLGKKENGFLVLTDKGDALETKTILIASGTHYRKLDVPGEKEFEGKGVFYCATCDAPLMKDKAVAVVGGGNSGFGAAENLLAYASKIYILEYSDMPAADSITQEKLKNSGKSEVITMAAVQEIMGDKFVKGLKYQNKRSGETKELAVDGIFVSIGYQPSSELVKDLAKLNNIGEIIIDPKTQQTSVKGIWAAGDVTNVLYKQGSISAGDAMKAALNIYDYLKNKQPQ